MNHEQKLSSLQKLFHKTQKIAQTQVEEFKNMSADKDKLALLIEVICFNFKMLCSHINLPAPKLNN